MYHNVLFLNTWKQLCVVSCLVAGAEYHREASWFTQGQDDTSTAINSSGSNSFTFGSWIPTAAWKTTCQCHSCCLHLPSSWSNIPCLPWSSHRTSSILIHSTCSISISTSNALLISHCNERPTRPTSNANCGNGRIPLLLCQTMIGASAQTVVLQIFVLSDGAKLQWNRNGTWPSWE